MIGSTPRGSSVPPKPGTLLIVDDEEPNRQLLSALLGAQGYHALLARDGPGALELIAQGNIDLVLLDVMMPGMDGIEVCRRVREQLADRDITIVFVTALSDRESRLRAKVAGANDFLVKPIDSYELSFRVENWMKLRNLRVLELEKTRLAARLEQHQGVIKAVSEQLTELASDCQHVDRDASTGPSLETVNQRLLRCAELLSALGGDVS